MSVEDSVSYNRAPLQSLTIFASVKRSFVPSSATRGRHPAVRRRDGARGINTRK